MKFKKPNRVDNTDRPEMAIEDTKTPGGPPPDLIDLFNNISDEMGKNIDQINENLSEVIDMMD